MFAVHSCVCSLCEDNPVSTSSVKVQTHGNAAEHTLPMALWNLDPVSSLPVQPECTMLTVHSCSAVGSNALRQSADDYRRFKLVS